MLTALSVPFLKEKVGPRRWAAVVVGFGALICWLGAIAFAVRGARKLFGNGE